MTNFPENSIKSKEFGRPAKSAIVNCSAFGVLDNMRINYDKDPIRDGQYPVGTRARYTCDDGLLKKDNAYGFCLPSGSWNQTQFTCIGI